MFVIQKCLCSYSASPSVVLNKLKSDELRILCHVISLGVECSMVVIITSLLSEYLGHIRDTFLIQNVTVPDETKFNGQLMRITCNNIRLAMKELKDGFG